MSFGMRRTGLGRGFTAITLVGFVGLTLAAVPSAHAQNLTGITVFATNATGAAPTNSDVWNTLGGDIIYNLWVTGPTGLAGPGSNGLTDGTASLTAFSLTTPGTYNFTIEGNPGVDANFHGINLFFNNSTTTPSISAYTQTASTATQVNTNFADGQNTLSLTGANTTGANTLSATVGANTVTLSNFRWEYSSVRGLDTVSPFSRTTGSGADNRGGFTLTVAGPASAAPEPGTLPLALTGLTTGIATIGTVRRRKAKGKHVAV